MFTKVLIASLAAGAFAVPLQKRDIWQPAVGTKWQIVISQPVDTSQTLAPSDAPVWDVDLFYTSADDVAAMKSQGLNVICYYSAGSAENWRPDYNDFDAADLGTGLEGWEGENWLNIRSDGVLNVMKKRIDMAGQKGCDAIDPDNMDGYSNGGGGFDLTQDDAITYLNNMASYAASQNMATGLKNAQEILPSVLDTVQFAVNEQCVASEGDGCTEYSDLLNAGKPVFHIEYDDDTGDNDAGQEGKAKKDADPGTLSQDCVTDGLGNQLSTVVKHLALDGWVEYCDGSTDTTAINEDYSTGDPKQQPGGGDDKANH